MQIRLKGGHAAADPRLGRLPQPDARNEQFPLRAVVKGRDVVKKTWRLKTRLDQGDTPTCVGHGWTHRLDAEPRVHSYGERMALDLYAAAQELDDWPGHNYDGTSVLAGAKACQARGLISVYRWAGTLDDVMRAVSSEGPVVVGTNWYDGFFTPDASGTIRPTGKVAGGHCYLLRGIDPLRERFRLSNSWGTGWSLGGDAWISFDDFDRLLKEDGEAVAPSES